MSKLQDLTRGLTTTVGDLHVKFKAGKITWEQLDAQAQYYEDRYLAEVIDLAKNSEEPK